MKVDLIRLESGPDAVRGVLRFDGSVKLVSLEDAWRCNRRNVSCIPAGLYLCERVRSPKFGQTFEVKDVPGRSAILFHQGNTDADTQGCILVGMSFGELNRRPSIVESVKAFERFRTLTARVDRFYLEIFDLVLPVE